MGTILNFYKKCWRCRFGQSAQGLMATKFKSSCPGCKKDFARHKKLYEILKDGWGKSNGPPQPGMPPFPVTNEWRNQVGDYLIHRFSKNY